MSLFVTVETDLRRSSLEISANIVMEALRHTLELQCGICLWLINRFHLLRAISALCLCKVLAYPFL